MSNMLDWAKDELDRYGFDFYGNLMNEAVLEVLETLVNQGHSGMSASIVIGLVDRLWSWKPLTPLTGEDDEWFSTIDPCDNTLQNKRYHSVFKNITTGEAYDIKGRVFAEPDGVTFTCRESRIPVTFPYMPPDKYPIYKLKYSSDDVDVAEALKKGLYTVE